MRCLISTFFLCSLLAGSSAEPVDSMLMEIGHEAPRFVAVNVRAESSDWSLLWNYTDSANYTEARFKMRSTGYDNDDYLYTSDFTVSRVVKGRTVSSQRFQAHHEGKAVGLRVQWFEGLKTLAVGDKQYLQTEEYGEWFQAPKPDSRIVLRRFKPSEVQWAEAESVEYENSGPSRFGSCEELVDYLRRSSDSLEGIWEYMDRNLPEGRVRLGGMYSLALVRDGECYRIIYVDGAGDYYGRLWKPLQDKGCMKPTIFQNHFDLEWINAKRTHRYMSDTWAEVEQGVILSLNFPLVKSQLRFRKREL